MDPATSLRIKLLRHGIPGYEIDTLSITQAQDYLSLLNEIEVSRYEAIVKVARIYIAESVTVALRDSLSSFFGKGTNALKKYIKELTKDEEPDDDTEKENEEKARLALEGMFNG